LEQLYQWIFALALDVVVHLSAANPNPHSDTMFKTTTATATLTSTTKATANVDHNLPNNNF
jgi:hypothetical protein